MTTITEKSELLFLYESKYSIPNGDPFTGEQRYDDETKKVLVSDVRIKRFIRDYWHESGQLVYVINPDPDNKLTAGQRFKYLFELRKDKTQTPRGFAKEFMDVRAFGAVIPIQKEKGKKKEAGEDDASAFNATGPVQFALLNPSLNQMDLRIHQNTSQFVSKEGDKQGTIGTTTVVPFALCQIHGWINPFSARLSGLTDDDVTEMLMALWNSVNNTNTRSKSNQSSLLLLQIVYKNPTDKLYGVDRFIKLSEKNADGTLRKRDEELRDLTDCSFDFSKLADALQSPKVAEIRYYTEIPEIQQQLVAIGGKLRPLTLFDAA